MRVIANILLIVAGITIFNACSIEPQKGTRFFLSNASTLQHTIQVFKDTSLIVSKEVKPGVYGYFDLDPGNYYAFVFDTARMSIYKIKEIVVIPPDTVTKKNNPYQYLELMKDARQMVISLDFLYNGNAYTDAIDRSMRKGKSGPAILESYEPNQFHTVDDKYKLSSYSRFVDFTSDGDIPDKTKSREYVYGFISVPPDKMINKEVWTDFVFEEIKKHSN